MTKLSDRVPDFPKRFWPKELAQQVEGHQKALTDLVGAVKKLTELVDNTNSQLKIIDQRERATAHRQDRLLKQLSEHIDVLMDAEAEQIQAKPALVGRRLVEEALAICERFDSWLTVRTAVTNIRKLLARAITEWPND